PNFFRPDYIFSFKLTSLDEATSRVRSSIGINPISKGSSVISLSKRAYTQQEATDIVNTSLRLLKEKELEEKNQVAINTLNYIREQMELVKEKVDSSSLDYQKLQKEEKIYDFEGTKGEILSNVLSLEQEKVQYQERISALNSVSNNVNQVGTKGMMDLQIAGLDEGNFTSEVGNLRQLEEQRKEMILLYKPSAREVQELDQKIAESKSRIQSAISASRKQINKELSDIQRKLAEYDSKAYQLPEKEKKFLDVSRGYTINDALYSELLSRYSQAELSIRSNVSDITIVDLAKFQGQAPIAPDKKSN